LWSETFGSTTDLRADGNRDGRINLPDYTMWRDHVGESAAAAAAGSAVQTRSLNAGSSVRPSLSPEVLEELGLTQVTFRVGYGRTQTVYKFIGLGADTVATAAAGAVIGSATSSSVRSDALATATTSTLFGLFDLTPRKELAQESTRDFHEVQVQGRGAADLRLLDLVLADYGRSDDEDEEDARAWPTTGEADESAELAFAAALGGDVDWLAW
jgi:hypothetical protein